MKLLFELDVVEPEPEPAPALEPNEAEALPAGSAVAAVPEASNAVEKISL